MPIQALNVVGCYLKAADLLQMYGRGAWNFNVIWSRSGFDLQRMRTVEVVDGWMLTCEGCKKRSTGTVAECVCMLSGGVGLYKRVHDVIIGNKWKDATQWIHIEIGTEILGIKLCDNCASSSDTEMASKSTPAYGNIGVRKTWLLLENRRGTSTRCGETGQRRLQDWKDRNDVKSK